MPPTLFGELEVSKSYGHTPLSNPCYIAPHVLCYISGNALNFLDTSVRGEAALSKHTNTKPIIADSQITAFGVCRKESLIAFAERGHMTVQIVKYPLGSVVGHFDQENDKDAILTAIEFSHDGKYLASLSGLPNYRVTVWDWKNNVMMAFVDSASPANTISFNPFNSLQFCTSFNFSGDLSKDDERGIKFWRMEMGFKSNSLKTISGRECCLQEQPPVDPTKSFNDIHISHTSEFHLYPRSHAWQVDQQVLSTVETGDAVVQYNPVNGESRVLFSVWKSRYEVEKERVEPAHSVKGVAFLDADIDLEELALGRTGGNQDTQITEELSRDHFLKKEYGGSENLRCILATKDSIILGGKDGVLRFVSYDGEIINQVVVITNGAEIASLTFSPDFKDVSITASDKCIYTCELSTHSITQNLEIESFGVVSMALFPVSDFVVTAHKDGTLKFWDPDTKRISNRFSVFGSITSIAAHPLSSVLAVGTETGILRIFDVAFATSDTPRLLMREKVSPVAIKELKFDPTGRYLLSFGDEECAVLVDIMKKCTILGFVHTRHPIASALWDIEETEDTEAENGITTRLFLYILNHNKTNRFSNILKYNVPLEEEVPQELVSGFSLEKFVKIMAKYRIDELVTDFVVVSSGVSSSRSFYTITDDKKLKNFGRPSNSHEDASEYMNLGTPILEFADHEKKNSKLVLSISTEWLFSYSPDGTVTARNFLEPEKSTKVFAHDSAVGGIQQLAISRDVHKLYSTGYDGVVRLFEWKSHMAAARRALIEAAEAAEIAFGNKLEAIKNVVVSLNQTPTRSVDPPDSENEPYYFDIVSASQVGTKVAAVTDKDGGANGFEDKIKVIRERLTKAMQRNETLPDLEKIPKTDFILDFAERDRLMAEADARVKQVRREIELENLKKRVIRNRIKAECWDSMEVIGASIKSFRPDPTTTKIAEVTNFPIKKKTAQEIQRIEKVKILRKIQLHVEAAARKEKSSASAIAAVPTDDTILESATTEAPPPIADEVVFNDSKSLLFSDFELTTNERKRTQIVLLGEAINEIKVEFNAKFKDFCKVKKDEILKIEDKNERILNITSELQVQEAIFKPVLDDDEVPERIIEVNDDEVKAEKFIGPEELKRIEARKREEEERRRAAQEDNYRERGLMIMMGGKLDDKSEETEKEELVKPDWMNKPREEMNEEERKLVKEFEKKLATMKEEQEKYRKALETELKKLQGFILELCDNFDLRLKELLVKKMEADQAIFKNELKRIKLHQSLLLAENDEAKEWRLNLRLEELKQEKMICTQYLPEIKKELDHFRDEYDTTLRRDKEIDKLFKKEFSTMDPMFELFYKLFKKREIVKTVAQEAADAHIESPFPGIDAPTTTGATDPIDEVYAPLNFDTDGVEGITQESWYKLVDLRDRKILSEIETKIAYRQFSEFQTIAQSVNDENERIRRETDKVMSDLASFAEYRFHTTYNPETLFELKQGQVEVPQAPVVTDYSDAELIHRSVVEKLNDNIVSLGKMKVDALKEMKEYRKGIHALEWENKMLDFQAEDLVIRTRDIQLLRVTKQMQEYIRGGDERKQTNEIVALEKRAEHNSKAHVHKLDDRSVLVEKYQKKITEKRKENEKLEARLKDLEVSVKERRKIHDVQVKRKAVAGGTGTSSGDKVVLNDIYTRRKLVDLAKSQAQDIAILREEVERLRLRTYPAFPSKSMTAGVAGI
ncbi:hypothetical protein BDR26DRAFT_825041 [Obelidium mucronatum]|nr:hypothetical protein BDR26DRAFT_825041 [Obelidium mucronatum]